jgi:hypothetical protein
MERNPLGCIVAVALLTLVTSCATTSLTSVWKDDSYKGGPLKKVLVVGVFQDEEAKNFFEDEFVRRLTAKGVHAIPGYSVLPQDSTLDRKGMDEKMKELGIDSVLVTRLVDVRDAPNYVTYPTRVDTQFFDYYVMCCQTMVSPGYFVIMETKIFESKHDNPIWSALSESSLDRSLENTLNSFIPVIIRNLQARNLIQ